MTETVAGLACAEFGDDALLRELAEVPAFTAFQRMGSSPRGLMAAGLRMAVPPIAYWLWLLAITATYALGAHLVKRRYPDWL